MVLTLGIGAAFAAIPDPGTSRHSACVVKTNGVGKLLDALGIPIGTSKSRLQRGPVTLRQAMALNRGGHPVCPGRHGMTHDLRPEQRFDEMLGDNAPSLALAASAMTPSQRRAGLNPVRAGSPLSKEASCV